MGCEYFKCHGYHFCPVLLSGVALFLVAFGSSLHTGLSRDAVFDRVEGNTWMYYTSQHSNILFRWDVSISSAMVTISVPFCWVVLLCFLWLSVRLCTLAWAGMRFSTELKVTRECIIPPNIVIFCSDGMWVFQVPWAKTEIGWHRFWSLSPPPQIRLCDILTIPLIGSKFPFFPFYTLLP